jgi:hypothetical protein
MRLAMRTMRVSLDEPLRNSSAPTLVMPRPTMPITIDAVVAMTTQTVVRCGGCSTSLLLVLDGHGSRSRMCGIPK